MAGDSYIEKIRERLREAPDSKLFLTLAEELRIRDEKDEALTVLREGLSRNPTFIPARVTLARWHYWDGRTDEARREFMTILEQAPDHAFAKLYLNEIEERAEKSVAAQAPPPIASHRPPKAEGDSRQQYMDRLGRFLATVKERFETLSPGPEAR